MIRLLFNILLIIALLYLPWWAGALIAIAGCFLIGSFFEVIIYGILADALFGTRFAWYGFPYAAMLYTALIFGIASVVRKRLAWDSRSI